MATILPPLFITWNPDCQVDLEQIDGTVVATSRQTMMLKPWIPMGTQRTFTTAAPPMMNMGRFNEYLQFILRVVIETANRLPSSEDLASTGNFMVAKFANNRKYWILDSVEYRPVSANRSLWYCILQEPQTYVNPN